MNLTLTLSPELEEQLQRAALQQRASPEAVALKILDDALAPPIGPRSIDEVVAMIRATPVSPANIRPATGSLEEALRTAPSDPEFDLDAWRAEWAEVEAEMRAITRANDQAETQS